MVKLIQYYIAILTVRNGPLIAGPYKSEALAIRAAHERRRLESEPSVMDSGWFAINDEGLRALRDQIDNALAGRGASLAPGF
jgi:hypothetical protein